MLKLRCNNVYSAIEVLLSSMKILDDRALIHVADYFRALAEPSRLKIINALRDGEHNVGELTELCACSQANVSKHLTLLAQAGLVAREARGTSVYYRIADPTIYQLCDLVCGQLAQHFADQADLHAAFGKRSTKIKKLKK
jgi:DNA-binding transcriptional ArsR family regulator